MTLRMLLLALAIGLCASSAFADFSLTPGVDLRLEYDDNIYLDPDNEKSDFITTLAPNLSLIWTTPRLDVTLLASVAMEKYYDHTDEDRIGADSNQTSSLNALARLYRQLFFLRVSDIYSRVPIDDGGRSGENNRTVNLTDSNTLQINPYLKFELMKDTSLQLGYTYENQWYGNQSDNYGSDSSGNNAESHLYSGSLTRDLSAKVSLSLNGSYKQYRPKNPDQVIIIDEGGVYDYDQKSASIGLTYKATERLTLNGQYGHSWLDYDVRSNTDASNWLASADYEITSAYKIGTSYTKDYIVSVDEGPSDTDLYSAYFEYDDLFNVKFSLFFNKSDFVEIDRSDDSYGGEISGELPFNNKTGIIGLVRYTNFDRSGTDEEKFDRYSARLALYYETRLGRISAGDTYNKNDSDLNSEDYTNNIVFVDASLKF